MKTSAIIIGAIAFAAAISQPAEARVDYYDSVRVNARSGYFNGQGMSGNISVNPAPRNSAAVLEMVPGRPIEFARDRDGRWWPSRSLGR